MTGIKEQSDYKTWLSQYWMSTNYYQHGPTYFIWWLAVQCADNHASYILSLYKLGDCLCDTIWWSVKSMLINHIYWSCIYSCHFSVLTWAWCTLIWVRNSTIFVLASCLLNLIYAWDIVGWKICVWVKIFEMQSLFEDYIFYASENVWPFWPLVTQIWNLETFFLYLLQ